MQLSSPERTRIQVDGVPSAITAEVRNRRIDGMIVTQALPFLRLDTPVTAEDGRRARISRVAIAMDGDVPRLLLELMDEDPEPLKTACARAVEGVGERKAADSSSEGVALDARVDETRADDACADEARAPIEADPSDDTIVSFTPGVSTRPARTDSTVPYEFSGRDSQAEVVLADEASLPPETLAEIEAPRPSWLRRTFARVGAWLASLFARPALSAPESTG